MGEWHSGTDKEINKGDLNYFMKYEIKSCLIQSLTMHNKRFIFLKYFHFMLKSISTSNHCALSDVCNFQLNVCFGRVFGGVFRFPNRIVPGKLKTYFISYQLPAMKRTSLGAS